MSYITDMSDESLQNSISGAEMCLEYLQQSLESTRNYLNQYRAELDRRKLEAFWRDHPGLQVKVGDKIAITGKYQSFYQNRARQRSFLTIGEVLEIRSLYQEDDMLGITATDGTWLTIVPIEIARGMREAYLKQERAK